MELVSKLSIKEVVGDVRAMVRSGAIEVKTDVMRVYGLVNAAERGESGNGDVLKFKGEFKAVNLMTGEEFCGANLYLPQVASDLLESGLREANETPIPDEKESKVKNRRAISGFNAIEFGFDITVQPNDTVVGYSYTAKPLLKTTASDVMARLESMVSSSPRLTLVEAETDEEYTPPASGAKAKKKSA